MFKRDNNRDFCLVQNLTKREREFNRFIRLENYLVIAAQNFGREENLSPALTLTMSKDMDEQLKLAHKVIDVVDQAKRRIRVTLLRYNVEKPTSSYFQIRIFLKKKKEEKFPQIVYVKFKLEEFIRLLEVMNSVYEKKNNNQRIFKVL